ncbi:hypothetical protein HanOQP8_Chr16g0636801 [Helianthus annuus]|nr:hypothetical protein HanOQP8_Chr16g0636801 [Helianthus annuus]
MVGNINGVVSSYLHLFKASLGRLVSHPRSYVRLHIFCFPFSLNGFIFQLIGYPYQNRRSKIPHKNYAKTEPIFRNFGLHISRYGICDCEYGLS